MYLRIFYKEKKTFHDYKNKKMKKLKKIEISRQGLLYGFGRQLAISPSFNFREWGQEKCLKSNMKIPLSRQKKREVQIVEKLRFSHFSIFLFRQ